MIKIEKIKKDWQNKEKWEMKCNKRVQIKKLKVQTANKKSRYCKQGQLTNQPFRIKYFDIQVIIGNQKVCSIKVRKPLKIKEKSGQQDLNLRPLGPQPSALPSYAIPRRFNTILLRYQIYRDEQGNIFSFDSVHYIMKRKI